jgi:hypothetical protein
LETGTEQEVIRVVLKFQIPGSDTYIITVLNFGKKTIPWGPSTETIK